MRIGSLFSGIGGLELGLEWAGVGHTVWQVEQDPYCLAVLAKHWPDAKRYTDVRGVGAHNLEPVDVICCGGFPCQDISVAGFQAGLLGDRSGLWYEYIRIVREMGPRFVVVENVSALLTRGLDDVLGSLADSGYDAEWSLLSACAVGAPHVRERLFVVAYADGLNGAQGVRDQFRAGLRSHERGDYRAMPRHGAPTWVDDPSALYRGGDGVPSRVDRVKSGGNAVVPQVAEVVGRRLMEIHAEREAVAWP